MKKKLNLKQAKEVIKLSYEINVPVLLLGSPGIGKTAIFRQLGLPVAVYEGPGTDDLDVKGFVFPDNINKTSFYGKSPLYPPFDKGILLIDELASARPEVMVALHSLFGERRLGVHKLPEGVVPMATGNRVQDRAGARQLLTALEDRITVIEVVPDVKVWLEEFAIQAGIHPLIISFLAHDANKRFLDTFEEAKIGESFATPRSWEIVSRYLYALEEDGKGLDNSKRPILEAILESKLGVAVATQFLVWYEYAPYMQAIEPILETKEPPKQILQKHRLLTNNTDAIIALCYALYYTVLRTENYELISRVLDTLELTDRAAVYAMITDMFENDYKSKEITRQLQEVIKQHKLYEVIRDEYRKVHQMKKQIEGGEKSAAV